MRTTPTEYKPKVGDSIIPDGWNMSCELAPGTDYSDSEFPGCDFYLTCRCGTLAANITPTGKDYMVGVTGKMVMMYKCRIKIEFVGDGEPSTMHKGWLYHD